MKRRISPAIEHPDKKIGFQASHDSSFGGLNAAGVAVPASNESKDVANNADFAMEWDEEWPDMELDVKEKNFTLDLSTWNRCKILIVEHLDSKLVKVTLEGKRCKQKAECHLLPPW
uniref:Uncharacterized protein n=1 Tax=Anopheles culicifacies TaxID=139723 RepID=A0A182LUG7_9DIPT